jgi:GNAT superfamily N-acetyltransferase
VATASTMSETSWSLRSMTADDVPIVAALHAASWRRAYRGILGDDYLDGDLIAEREGVWRPKLVDAREGHGWIAVHDATGDALGFVFLRPRADAQWGSLVDNLHVVAAEQGRGIGRALLAAVGVWCAAQAAEVGVYLWVFTENHAARGFYARVGGAEVEAVEQLASDGRMLPELRVAWSSPTALLAATARRGDVRDA